MYLISFQNVYKASEVFVTHSLIWTLIAQKLSHKKSMIGPNLVI